MCRHLVQLALAMLATACGRIGFDAVSSSDAPSGDAAVIPSCTTWGPFGTPQIIAELSSPATDWAPSVSRDGLQMLFSSMRLGSQDLFVATRASTADAWGALELLDGFGTGSEQEDDPTLSVDGLEIYYGKNELRRATRSTTAEDFGPFEVIVPATPTFSLVQGAELSSDELRLYFSAGDPALTLFVMERASRADEFSTFTAIDIASNNDDLGYPTISADDRELIVSKALTSPQDRDLFIATRPKPGDPFTAPVAITELASVDEEWDPELSFDGTTLWFASTRDPAEAQDIFVTTRACLD